MIQEAVHYNNVGVDILSSNYYKNTEHLTRQTICRSEHSGQAHAKRRKLANVEANEGKGIERNIDQQVDEALVYFQKALSLIVQTTEHHRFCGKGLKYHPNDNEGFMKFENDKIAKELTESINSCATEINLKGENGFSNSYIYCNAIKIDGYNHSKKNIKKSRANKNKKTDKNLVEGRESDDVVENVCDEDTISRALHKHSQAQKPHDELGQTRKSDIRRKQYSKNSLLGATSGYDALTTSFFHSMICIYNIALCYQYKGMKTKESAKRIQAIADTTLGPTKRKIDHTLYHFYEFDRLVASSEYFLKASVDHYTRAYELMSRFRLKNGSQYTLLMATMNNLAATYQSLEQSYKADICNRYLMKSLILIICSSERDGHLGQEVLSRSSHQEEGEKFNRFAGVLSREEDRISFESFLSNVTHLMMGGDEIYRGEITAIAA